MSLGCVTQLVVFMCSLQSDSGGPKNDTSKTCNAPSEMERSLESCHSLEPFWPGGLLSGQRSGKSADPCFRAWAV